MCLEPVLERLVLPSFRAAVPQSGSKEGGTRSSRYTTINRHKIRVTGVFLPHSSRYFSTRDSLF